MCKYIEWHTGFTLLVHRLLLHYNEAQKKLLKSLE